MHHAHIDKFAYQQSVIHRLDPRIKLAVALLFTLLIVSLPRNTPATVVCYCLGPFTVLVIARIPIRFALRHILLISPFILVLALTCPIYDKAPRIVPFGPFIWHLTEGWMRCFTIVVKFLATMLALIALISTTRFSDLLVVLQRWRVPEILVIQLGFLYRYLFVFIDKDHHILRARSTRTLRRLPLAQERRIVTSMIGSLLIQSLDTAGRITTAMQARGFVGQWHSVRRFKLHRPDWMFMGIAVLYSAGIWMMF